MWCHRAPDIGVVGDKLTVQLHGGRKQRVTVREAIETLELLSVVVRAADVPMIEGVETTAWRRNRTALCVGFRFDGTGRLVAESWLPKVGLTETEFLSAAVHLAVEADLFEYQLTGNDRE